MELVNIYGLDLYVDREVELEEDTVLQRVRLEDDMQIGEVAYFEKNRNKLIKHDENDYMFYRFDEIQTHIDNASSSYTFDDVNEKIIKKLDYNLEYADDRVQLVNKLLAENEWIYDLVSSNSMIQKEQKKKKDFLAEDQLYDQMMDRISDYLCHPKFKNEKDRQQFEELEKEKELLAQKKKISSKENKELCSVTEKLSDYQSYSKQVKYEEVLDKTDRLNDENVYSFNNAVDLVRKRYINKTEFDVTFWNRMGYTEEQKTFRNGLINSYEQSLLQLQKLLGYGKPLLERQEIQKDLLKTIKDKTYYVNGKTVYYSAKRQLKALNEMYSSLKSDFDIMLEKLTDQIRFKRLDRTSEAYQWNQDTVRTEMNNEIEISKNLISFANTDVFKGMLLNYFGLKDKYRDRMHDDMWAILRDFDDLLQDIRLDEHEKVICHMIMNDAEIKEISRILKDSEMKISKDKLYRYINTYIPKKLREKHLEKVDNWLYTYKIKGSYKQCNKCKEMKLISNDRYFNKEPKGKDGFKTICKTCQKT